MTRRYLFGPVTSAFAQENLGRQRGDGRCLAFNAMGDTDLRIEPGDSWGQVCAKLPPDWQPDFVVLNLAYNTIPGCFWTAPVPLLGVALDYNLMWHYYRRRLPSCDAVVADPHAVEIMGAEGIYHTVAANLYGCDASYFETSWPHEPRPIDVLLIGNLNPAVHPGRVPWLPRLARLGQRRRVAIHSGVFGAPYRQLLGLSRIVFAHGPSWRLSRRAAEAAAAGALLFQEAENTHARTLFRDRRDCVFYSPDNLEHLLEHYLEHEDERRAIVDSARQRAASLRFEELWQEVENALEQRSSLVVGRSRRRVPPRKLDELLTRGCEAASAPWRSDPHLIRDLEEALRADPHSAPLHHALGLAVTRLAPDPGAARAVDEVAASHFRRAVDCQPSHVVARLSLAEALAALGHTDKAVEEARSALAILDRLGDLETACLDAGHFRADFGTLWMEWERAAWAHAGRPADEARAKQQLLRWQANSLLARWTGNLMYHYEAVLARPDLTPSYSSLGCALASAGHAREALPHLRRALAGNPLDREAARATFHCHGLLGHSHEQAALADDRRWLARAAPSLVPWESWFAEPPPSGNELASIIVLCWNQVDATRLCLESVLRCSRAPYELILVDNGSEDDTPRYLEEIRTRPGPVRVEVIRNPSNRGFAAGCNQAFAQARGRYLVLLNNDTVVTSGWLEGLIRWTAHEWPTVGMVGAVTNGAPEPQGIACGYTALDGLEDFAARRRRDFDGKMLEVRRLTGFCLLIRREVLDRIGPFDERFGLGFFEDDDLCVRARLAGFRLLVALSVYVHHVGNRTFAGMNLDRNALLQANFEVFRKKWGPEHATGYQLMLADKPPSAPAATPAAADVADVLEPDFVASLASSEPEKPADSSWQETHQVPTSLCMIVKNEEPRLGACLDSAAELFGEVIVVDTGSTDRTKEVAARHGARVFDFPWIDSFGAARNECLRHARGKWIMWLDGDDRLDADNRKRLRDLFAGLGEEMDAYAMKVRSTMDAANSSYRLLDQVRLFRRHPQIRWEYRVHEQILPAVRKLGGNGRWSDVIVDHVGYQDAATRRHKLERNWRLLERDNQEKPDDAFTLFNLGWTSLDLGRTAEALTCLQRALELSAADSSIVRKLYHLVAVTHRQLGQRDQALAVCKKGLALFPDDTELIFEEASLLLEKKDLAGAERDLLLLVETRPGPYFASVDDGMRGFKTRHFLAGLYREQRRHCEAEIQLRAALLERPAFAPAWPALGELFLEQQRWTDVDWVAATLHQHVPADAALLRARAHFARNEFGPARSVLEELIRHSPALLGPRVLLSHVLLKEGKDGPAAEHALRDILTLDPNNSEAQHNLSVLVQRLQDRMPNHPPLVK